MLISVAVVLHIKRLEGINPRVVTRRGRAMKRDAVRRCAQCGQGLPQQAGPGRPARYCSAACGRAYRGRAATVLAALPQGMGTVPAAQAVSAWGVRLLQAQQAHAPLAEQFELVRGLERALECYRAAAVWQARICSGATWQEIADAARCGTATARVQFSRSALERLFAQRANDLALRAAQGATGQPSAVRSVPVPLAARHESTPVSRLASALALVCADSGLTHGEVARRVGATRSYVTRVLAGSSRPTWRVTRQIVLVCGGDPANLRALWEAARGLSPAAGTDPLQALSALQAALRGLYLAAARPPLEHLRAASGQRLTAADIDVLLGGRGLPDWEKARCFITTLRGRPDDLRPLWERAHERAPSSVRPPRDLGPQAMFLSAEAFG
ncbi:helix-turn-helix domain-containing protein [Streptomyces sp. cg36]|uniref:helix-turn-helix domain-containing protein n=1 Tax=Streptomyces sp. cg36 TaxID=3238798 RepID=UPI0034E25F66